MTDFPVQLSAPLHLQCPICDIKFAFHDQAQVDMIRYHLVAHANEIFSARASGGEQTSGEARLVETGWLIERGHLCLGYDRSCLQPAWVTFTDPTAIRFSRMIDAANFITVLTAISKSNAFEGVTFNEHQWCDAAPSSPAQAAPDGALVEKMCKAFIAASAGQHTITAMTTALRVAEAHYTREVTDEERRSAETRLKSGYELRTLMNELLTSRRTQAVGDQG
jgi:hypothetical protein